MKEKTEENDSQNYDIDNEEKNNNNLRIINQKFNIEKYENRKIVKNFQFCQKCNSSIKLLFLNEKIIKLLFNQSNNTFISNNDDYFINEIIKTPNLCQNCFKLFFDEFYFKKKDKISNGINKIDSGILEMLQVFEKMDEEKLNINLKLYNTYKKLINSFVYYIKDDLNSYKNVFDENAQNIKNQKIIGIDCMLNIIDLLNKNISLIKEKNEVKKLFFEQINKEKNILIKENSNNMEFNIKNKEKDNAFENADNLNLFDNKDNNQMIIGENKNINKNLKGIQNMFKTKIVRKKKKNYKGKRIKRTFKKIKFNIIIK